MVRKSLPIRAAPGRGPDSRPGVARILAICLYLKKESMMFNFTRRHKTIYTECHGCDILTHSTELAIGDDNRMLCTSCRDLFYPPIDFSALCLQDLNEPEMAFMLNIQDNKTMKYSPVSEQCRLIGLAFVNAIEPTPPRFDIGTRVRVHDHVNSMYAGQIGTVVRRSEVTFVKIDSATTPFGSLMLSYHDNELEAIES